jgi:putative DNA primase/helicase
MIVDLRTGTAQPPRAEAYCTKSTAVKPGGDCPRWHQFLAEITGDDEDLQVYLRRVAGYCLTAEISEHVLFFCYGVGSNGKSVFINTLARIMGDYATVAPMELLIDSKNERHPTEIARLRGARLVTANETEAGRPWAEAKIKLLTGGDRLTGRFMRQDFFDFDPQFKLMISGNHKPRLRSVIEATRRRIHLIPFTVTIPPAQRDLQLPDKLKTEWPGILQWMIDGALEWRRMGLAPPKAVIDATNAYLASEDAIGNWIDECCLREPRADALKQTQAFGSWKAWAEAAQEIVGKRKDFYESLDARGFACFREAGTGQRLIRGLLLKPVETLL